MSLKEFTEVIYRTDKHIGRKFLIQKVETYNVQLDTIGNFLLAYFQFLYIQSNNHATVIFESPPNREKYVGKNFSAFYYVWNLPAQFDLTWAAVNL